MMRSLALALFLLLTATVSKANDVYISQSGGGTGGSCASPVAVAAFNNAANWAPTGTLIGPGATIHLCGTISSTMIAQGSGASGQPVTILFESGAKISQPVCPSTGCLVLDGKTDITVDGAGTGSASAGSFSAVGILENTASGSSLSNTNPTTFGISAASVSRVTIKNLLCQNMYVQVSGSSADGDSSNQRCISYSGSDITINNNKFIDCGWCVLTFFATGNNNIAVSNNDFSHAAHGSAFGGATTTTNATNYFIFGNHYHDNSNWNNPLTNCPGMHVNGIHIYNPGNGSGTGTLTGLWVHDNLFDGTWGPCVTGHVFIEGGSANARVINQYWWNNVSIVPAGEFENTNGWFDVFSGPSGEVKFFNNTVIGPRAANNAVGLKIGSVNNLTFKNNAITGFGGNLSIGSLSGTTVINDNGYDTFCNLGNCFVWNGSFTSSFTNWKAACSCDANSTQSASPLQNSDGSLQTGSPFIQQADNLSSLATGNLSGIVLDTTKAGARSPISRPSGTCTSLGSSPCWDIGAFQASASSGPAISLTPSPVAFGNQTVSTTSSPITVTVQNTGSATEVLSTPYFTISGTNASDFANTGGTCVNGGTIAAGSSCTSIFTFTPAASGSRSATLTINGTVNGTDSLTGTGVSLAPVLTLTPSPVAFGSQNVGTTSSPISVTVQNTGNAQETLGTPFFSITGANASDFATTGGSCTTGQVLNPGASCITNFAFTPSAAGARSATLTILGTVNGTDSMTGTGVASNPIISLTPNPISFGSQTVGTTSSPITVTVSNSGTGPEVLSTPYFTITGTNASDFAKTGGTCTNGGTIAAGSSCTSTYTFTPSAKGSRTATLTILGTVNATDAISGTGKPH